MDLLCRERNKKSVCTPWRTVSALTRVLFCVEIPRCLATREINTKIILSSSAERKPSEVWDTGTMCKDRRCRFDRHLWICYVVKEIKKSVCTPWRTVSAVTRVLFCVEIPRCLATREINTKIILSSSAERKPSEGWDTGTMCKDRRCRFDRHLWICYVVKEIKKSVCTPWRTVSTLARVLFCVEIPRCLATREINTKIILSWALKQFITLVHTLFSISLTG